MKCAEALDRLDDLVDGLLPEPERLAVEDHLASCDACRKEEQRLRAILAAARALPREKTPPRDLWPEIAQAIGAKKVVPLESGRLKAPRWWRPALAAAAVLAAVATVVALRGGGSPFGEPGTRTATAVPVAGGHVDLLDAEQGYARAADELLAALAERRDSLSPETRASVDRNLAVIDQALKEIRDALQKEPGNAELTRMLASTHRKKVDVLRRMVKLSGAAL
jgi:anti-sigma factor RsiW